MKVYKISYHHPDIGCQLAWAASQREAKKALREIIAGYDNPQDAEPGNIEQVDIPTDKAGLIDWLNRWVDTDNG